MNLLLLLSALLSALTGVGATTRGAEPVAAVAGQVIAVSAASHRPSAAVRRVELPARRIAHAWVRIALEPAPNARAPLYLSRLRR